MFVNSSEESPEPLNRVVSVRLPESMWLRFAAVLGRMQGWSDGPRGGVMSEILRRAVERAVVALEKRQARGEQEDW